MIMFWLLFFWLFVFITTFVMAKNFDIVQPNLTSTCLIQASDQTPLDLIPLDQTQTPISFVQHSLTIANWHS